MKPYSLISIVLTGVPLFFMSCAIAFAANATTEFFSSNNSNEIDVKKAYQRLVSKVQLELQNSTINILQNNHIEQGKFESVLGTYKMSTDQNITADNSEIFHTSPQQTLNERQTFAIAAQLSNALNQDSIAVFIPSERSLVGEIIVHFIADKQSITDTIKMINEKLPPSYSQAFSLHLSHTNAGFDHATVNAVEWLGSTINIDQIKAVFPQDQVTSENGNAFLVYKNGKIQRL